MIFGIIVLVVLAMFAFLFAIWGFCEVCDFERAGEILGKILLMWLIFILISILFIATINLIGAITEGV